MCYLTQASDLTNTARARDIAQKVTRRFLSPQKRRAFRMALTHVGVGDRAAIHLGLEKVCPSDVFIVSFPKSGNTWVRFLLSDLLEPHSVKNLADVGKIVPDIYHDITLINKMLPPRYIKSHDPNFEMFPRTLYIVRDVRDVMVSYYNYCCGNDWFNGTISAFIRNYLKNGSKFGFWHEHVKKALEFSSSYPNRCLMIKYEDLLCDITESARAICSFTGLRKNTKEIEHAVKVSDFSTLSSIEDSSDCKSFMKTGKFFRRGSSGQWQEWLNEDDLRLIYEKHEPILSELGYL